VCLGSEDDVLAGRLTELLPDACHFYPREALTHAVMALRSGEPLPQAPYEVLDMPLYFQELRLVDAQLLRAAVGAGKWVNVWTVDDPDEMRALLQEGVG